MSSIQRILKIANQRGLHARASAKFVKCIEKYDATINVSKDGHVVAGDSIMDLMMLAASQGSQIHISADGPQADQCMDAIAELIEAKFYEDE